MKIDRVTVTYGELRSTGYPSFSNKRHEVGLSATLDAGETAEEVKDRLLAICKVQVGRHFGDALDAIDPMQVPF